MKYEAYITATHKIEFDAENTKEAVDQIVNKFGVEGIIYFQIDTLYKEGEKVDFGGDKICDSI